MPEQTGTSSLPEKTTANLVPSQVVQSDNQSANKKKGRNRRPRGARKPKSQAQSQAKSQQQSQAKPQQQSQSESQDQSQQQSQSKSQSHVKKTKKKKKRGKKYSWRKHIQNGVVDPISLEPLVKLTYPPFALAISKPYTPIIWPKQQGQKGAEANGNEFNERNEMKRQEQILEEQWGSKLPPKKDNDESNDTAAKPHRTQEQKSASASQEEKEHEHLHLFDGRVLAYYLVSQLQFIDPLNRRDLTREEIIHLDSYLKRNRLKQASVVEAYDNKGVTLNSAGISGQTSGGRAEILQQEALVLFNSLFQENIPRQNNNNNINNERRGNRRRNNRQRENEGGNEFARQYAAFENGGRNERSERSNIQNNNQSSNDQMWNSEDGVYGHEGGGMMIIDDNANPGLRGVTDLSNVMERRTRQSPNAPITSWHGHRPGTREDNFPALPTSANEEVEDITPPSSTQLKQSAIDPSKKKVSKSLLKIGAVVEKTNPKQIEKQKKAREEALRKLEMANMAYEEYVRRNDAYGSQNTTEIEREEKISTLSTSVTSTEPTEKQIERNRNLANALGVTPSTVRNTAHYLNGGWKRPTSSTISIDAFGNELNLIEYPDNLITEARDRMTELLKLEKKWIEWLNDDKAASCSLKKMDKITRIFVHTYSDFWNIQTQSYDPEPRRYIHCVKMLETRAPRPLLSEAVRNWRGPIFAASTTAKMSQESTDEITLSTVREFPISEDRVPLKLSSRKAPTDGVNPPLVDDITTENDISAFSNQEPTERFASLLAERERPKLTLDPRTKPLELPPYQSSQKQIDEEIKNMLIETKKAAEMKRHQEEDRKRRILESAFASDDEQSSDDSEWEVGEALYSGSDEE